MSTAECTVMSYVAAGSAADAQGGSGQRKVQTEDPYSHACSTFTSLRAFSRRDPTVSNYCCSTVYGALPFLILYVCGGLQVFSSSVSNGGRSASREAPRLWQHVAPSRQGWMLAGCHNSTRPQRVNAGTAAADVTDRKPL